LYFLNISYKTKEKQGHQRKRHFELQRKIMILTCDSKSLLNLRFDMMQAFQSTGLAVIAAAPRDANYDRVKETLKKSEITLMQCNLRNTSLNPFNDVKMMIQLYQLFKETKPDYLFSYAIKPVIYGSLVGRMAGIKSIVSMMSGLGHLYTYDNAKTRLFQTMANVLYRFAFKANKVVIFQNLDDRQLFLNLRLLNENKTRVVAGSGVHLDKFPATALPDFQPLRFLFVGRLLEAKGFNEYCQAAAKLKSLYPQVEFQVLGGFHANPSAIDQSFLNRLTETSIITYLGEQEHSLEYLKQSHVVVLPSYREGVPKSLLEALAVGRAIVTTNVPGCRETVIAGKNGLLVSPRDSESLAGAMETLIQDPQQIKRMALESRKLAEAKFDVRRVNQQIIEFMELNSLC